MSIYATKMQEIAKFDIFWKLLFLLFFYNMYLQSYVFGQLQTIEAIACTWFGLQRCTLPQVKALEILFWPLAFLATRSMKSRSCEIFLPRL